MQIPNWLRPPKGIQWTPQLGATLALVVIAGAMAFSGIISLVLALFTFGANADLSTTLESAVKKHEQLAKVDRDRFDGRSVFLVSYPASSLATRLASEASAALRLSSSCCF